MRAVALAAILLIAACSSTAAPPTTIPHALGPKDVIIQYGVYDLSTIPDQTVVGPEIVVYGDGEVYTNRYDGVVDGVGTHQLLLAHFDEPTLQHFLQAANELPTDPPPDPGIADGWSTPLIVNGSTWYLPTMTEPFRAYLDDLDDAVRDSATGTWTPKRWVANPPNADCVVTEEPSTESWFEWPVFPDVMDEYPLGEFDCFA